MYLLSNNISQSIKLFLLSFLLIILQIYIPKIWLLNEFPITIDFFLVCLTVLVFLNHTYHIIFFAFLLGLFQDFVVQFEMIGLYAFIKSLSVFCIGYSKQFNHLWIRNIKLLYIFLVYFFHFLIYLSVLLNYSFTMIIIGAFFQACICFVLFYLIERIFYNTKLI